MTLETSQRVLFVRCRAVQPPLRPHTRRIYNRMQLNMGAPTAADLTSESHASDECWDWGDSPTNHAPQSAQIFPHCWL